MFVFCFKAAAVVVYERRSTNRVWDSETNLSDKLFSDVQGAEHSADLYLQDEKEHRLN